MIEIVSFKMKEGGTVKAEFSINCNGFRINGMRIIEKESNVLIVSFPFWKDNSGNSHEYIYPVDDKLKSTIDTTLIQAFNALCGYPVEVEVSKEETLNATLRDINLKLKQSH